MTTLNEAIKIIKAGDLTTGRNLLSKFLETHPENETAWMWLAVAVEKHSQKKYCLERVLQINPNNSTARHGLLQFEDKYKSVEMPGLSDIVQASPSKQGNRPPATENGDTPSMSNSNSLNEWWYISLSSPIRLMIIIGGVLLGFVVGGLITSSISVSPPLFIFGTGLSIIIWLGQEVQAEKRRFPGQKMSANELAEHKRRVTRKTLLVWGSVAITLLIYFCISIWYYSI